MSNYFELEREVPEIARGLTGKTHADNQRHAHLRGHFMNALLPDTRVSTAIDDWGERYATGLKGAAGNEDAERALLDDVVSRAVTFVRDALRLPWAWLVWELLECARWNAEARIRGVSIEVSVPTYEVDPMDPLAPQLAWSLNFETRTGETIAEALRRLEMVAAETASQHAAMKRALQDAERKALGRAPKQDTGYLQDWATWFYRTRVKGDPIAAIARDHGVTRRKVQLAAREVERLLGSVRFKLKPPLRK